MLIFKLIVCEAWQYAPVGLLIQVTVFSLKSILLLFALFVKGAVDGTRCAWQALINIKEAKAVREKKD